MFDAGMFLANDESALMPLSTVNAGGVGIYVSDDSNTVLQARPADGFSGAIEVFTRSGGSWTSQFVSTNLAISPRRYIGPGAISGDGNTFCIGVSRTNTTPALLEEIRVFVRSGGTWSLQQTITVGVSPATAPQQLAMSGDGNTIAILFHEDNTSYDDQVRVYTRSGGTWSISLTHNGIDVDASYQPMKGIAVNGDGTRVYYTQIASNLTDLLLRSLVFSGGSWSVGPTASLGTNSQQPYVYIKCNSSGSFIALSSAAGGGGGLSGYATTRLYSNNGTAITLTDTVDFRLLTLNNAGTRMTTYDQSTSRAFLHTITTSIQNTLMLDDEVPVTFGGEFAGHIAWYGDVVAHPSNASTLYFVVGGGNTIEYNHVPV